MKIEIVMAITCKALQIGQGNQFKNQWHDVYKFSKNNGRLLYGLDEEDFGLEYRHRPINTGTIKGRR